MGLVLKIHTNNEELGEIDTRKQQEAIGIFLILTDAFMLSFSVVSIFIALSVVHKEVKNVTDRRQKLWALARKKTMVQPQMMDTLKRLQTQMRSESLESSEDVEREADKIIQTSLSHSHTFRAMQNKKGDDAQRRVLERLRSRTTLSHSKKLLSIELFSGQSPESIRKVVQVMEFRYFKQGKYLVKEGEAANELFVIMQGHVTVFRGGSEVRKLGPLSVIGEAALVSDSHVRSASVMATVSGNALVLTRERFDDLKADGTLSTEAQKKARRMSTRYDVEDAQRLAAAVEAAKLTSPQSSTKESSDDSEDSDRCDTDGSVEDEPTTSKIDIGDSPPTL